MEFHSKVLVLKFPGKIPSVNEHLQPGIVKKKSWDAKAKKMVIHHVPVMFKSEVAKNYQSYILKELRKITTADERNVIRKWKWYKIKIEVVMNHNFEKRDADNIIKLTNDVVFNQFLRVDDRFCNSVTSEKYEDMTNRNEWLIITLTENSDNRKKFQT